MKNFPNVLLAILLSLFGASFFGVLFVSGDAWLQLACFLDALGQ